MSARAPPAPGPFATLGTVEVCPGNHLGELGLPEGGGMGRDGSLFLLALLFCRFGLCIDRTLEKEGTRNDSPRAALQALLAHLAEQSRFSSLRARRLEVASGLRPLQRQGNARRTALLTRKGEKDTCRITPGALSPRALISPVKAEPRLHGIMERR